MITTAIPHSLPIPRGLFARVAVQCTCPDTGATGSFLFTGESHRTSCSRVTPVYADLAEMFPAIRADWEQVAPGDCGYGYTKR